MWRVWAEVCFWCAALMCLSPDSACDKNTVANVVASKEAIRNSAFHRFIPCSCPERVRGFSISIFHRYRTAADDMQVGVGATILPRNFRETQADSCVGDTPAFAAVS